MSFAPAVKDKIREIQSSIVTKLSKNRQAPYLAELKDLTRKIEKTFPEGYKDFLVIQQKQQIQIDSRRDSDVLEILFSSEIEMSLDPATYLKNKNTYPQYRNDQALRLLNDFARTIAQLKTDAELKKEADEARAQQTASLKSQQALARRHAEEAAQQAAQQKARETELSSLLEDKEPASSRCRCNIL